MTSMATESENAEAERLDDEIASLKEQVAAAKRQLKVEASTIASSEPGQKLMRSAESSSMAPSRPLQTDSDSESATPLTPAQRQEAHIQQSVYRICSPVTTFKVRDPDPNAVDGGHVLALRFEVMSRGQFLNPYYVMLNRPYPNSPHLRVHRHTLPPAIPIAGLAARHLPPPRSEGDSAQDLDRFARTLRREVARYHNRLGVTAGLRRLLGTHRQRRGSPGDNHIVDVGIADVEAKQIRLTWADDRSGRLVMDDDGNVVKLAVYGSQGRDWETTNDIGVSTGRIEDVVQRLQEYSAG